LIYADIVHAAGCEPFVVTASGIDFASCSSFKWLMGDFGLGSLYVGDSNIPKRLQAAKVSVRVAQHWLRVSPSLYNDMTDIERLLEALT
jgi:selenocysteine lyase/cysteine desulfurase